MPRTTAQRVSYLRDLENLRRFKEGVNKDPLINDETKNLLGVVFELIHMTIGMYEDEESRRMIIETKVKRLYEIVFEKKNAATNGAAKP